MNVPRWVWILAGVVVALVLFRPLRSAVASIQGAGLPAWAWALIVAALAVYFFHHARAGIAGKANPHILFDVALVGLLALLAIAMANYQQHPSAAGGSEPLERVNLCPQGTNLAGCPNYVAPAIDPAHDIPETTVPDYRPAPTWANDPGR